MAIQSQQGKGLEVELKDFVKLRAHQSGGEFWGHENQTVIRQYLGDFLPLMEVQQDGKTVLAQHFVDGKEVASQSLPATKGIPRSERARLEAAVSKLKAKAEDPATDPNTQAIVKAFRLPDPQKDSELYRIYGSRFSPKLLVVWGCEKEPGTSIVPEAASAKIKGESASAGLLRRSPWVLLMLLIILLGYFAFQSDPVQDRRAEAHKPPVSTDDGKAADTPRNESSNTAGGESTGEAPLAGAGQPDKPQPGEDKMATTDPEKTTESKTQTEDGSSSPAGATGESATNTEVAPLAPTQKEGTGSTEAASPDEPLVVQELDPESNDPDAVVERPAENNLVDLAKITRSAVVLIKVTDAAGKVKGTGSGFVFSPEGLIATNYHVLEGADGAIVKMGNGDTFPMVKIVASDAKRDLAVFSIDLKGKGLPYLSLDEGPASEVGEKIAVVGSPLGLEGTFSIGIVSATRKIEGTDYLQITAPISPGSSGSPVVDYEGNVVGVAVGAIEAGQSLNFAVAISELIELLNSDESTSDSLIITSEDPPLNRQDPENLPPSAANGIIAIAIIEGDTTIMPQEPSSATLGEAIIPTPTTERERYRVVQTGKTDLPEGTVKLALEVRDENGKFVKLVDPKWSLDGQQLPPPASVGNQREITVKKGEHDLLITGKTESGEPVEITAGLRVDVEIQSAVKIKQSEK